jgi:hypothetical protein
VLKKNPGDYMSTAEDKIRDFLVARGGEVEGLEAFEKHIGDRAEAFKGNVERVQLTSTAILAAFDRVNVAIDSQLLKVNPVDPETITQQLLDVISEIRRAIRNEEQTAVREFGFVYGSLNTASETMKTIGEKITSTKSSVENQKTLLERADRSDGTEDQRQIGERPIPLKDERTFNQIISNDEKSD